MNDKPIVITGGAPSPAIMKALAAFATVAVISQEHPYILDIDGVKEKVKEIVQGREKKKALDAAQSKRERRNVRRLMNSQAGGWEK